ncbi:MAG: electron transport complex subunit RsxC [Gammaproteobacteria bacterium]|nr:electron transport complex subunit RsxC [Gammaproteobacteria bacterium]
MKRQLKKAKQLQGGIKLQGFKSLSNATPVQTLPVPPQLIIPLKQHIGEAAKPIVNVGSQVYKGQIIAEPNGYISSPVHASSSGVVAAIEARPIPHASHIRETCIVIHTDGKDQWHPSVQSMPKPLALSAEDLRRRIREAGIAGLGGAVFPSAVKLKPTSEIGTLIINGVECEPYITCDDVLMRYHADAIIQGALLLARIVRPRKIVVAIEDNKPQACQSITNAINRFKAAGVTAANTIHAAQVPEIFPAGGEKQLIKVLTGKEVPSGSLPYELGIVCLNVGTTAAIYDALYLGQPLVSRIMTVTGEGLDAPGNYRVSLGTPIHYVLAHAGFARQQNAEVIMGGPMMGVAIADHAAPVVKATNCLLIKNTRQIRQPAASMPCIRCGQCATVCPIRLLPQQLYWHARSKAFEKLANYHIDDCIECGCCQVVCPAKLPLVHYFRFAKSEIKARGRERKKADVSRLRNEARCVRLEKIRIEQEERKARRKAIRKQVKPPDTNPDQSMPVSSNASSSEGVIPEAQTEESPPLVKHEDQAKTMVR